MVYLGMKEKTFAVKYHPISATPRFGYMFLWNDGEMETWIPVSLHGAMALAQHFDSIGYQDMVNICLHHHHEYVELNYRKDHEERLRQADMADLPPLAD